MSKTPVTEPPVTGKRRAAAYDWVRHRLDYLIELPEPGNVWNHHDLDGGAQAVFETLRRNTDYDVIVPQRTVVMGDQTEVTLYQTDEEWWAFIQHLRDQRNEFNDCSHSAGVHHVENPRDDEKQFTCGNEYCDARYTRDEVLAAMDAAD